MIRKEKKFLPIWYILFFFCLLCIASIIEWRMNVHGLPDNVGHKLTLKEQVEIIADNSSMIKYVYLSPNATFPREKKIKKITIHHMAGTISLERLGEVFADPSRHASSNYAIDINGNVGLYVEEKNRAWTSSSPQNDNQAVTIEVANDENGGEWHVSDESYQALIELCEDICRRNEIKELIWTGDETGTLTIHKFFNTETECPGPYLESLMDNIANEVTKRLNES